MIKPKLALIPSGYSDGKVYSVLPSNGDGDFTFSRGSNATRVNKDGLIETMPLELGSEILSGLDFTNWAVLGGASSVSSDEFTTTSAGGISKTSLLTVGKDYKAVISGTTTSANTQIRTSNNSFTYFNWDYSGSFSFEFVFTATSTTGLYIRHSGVGTTEVDNFSVKEVTSGYDLPRLDYTDSSCPSLLLEPQRTNLIDYSEDFSQSVWQKQSAGVASTPIITNNYTISPDGNLNADRVVFNLNGATNSDFSQIADSITNSIGDVTNSIWIKSNTESNYNMSFVDPKGYYTSIMVTTEWQRFDVTSTTVSTSSALRLRLRGSEATSDYADVSVWGAQVEEGSYATSYIPTNGATATRYADVCNGAGTSDTFNDSEGVLMAEISALANDGTNRRISISDGSTNNRIVFSYSSTNNQFQSFLANPSVQFNFYHTLNNSTEINKIALKYKLNDFALWINGVEVATDNSGTLPIGMNRIAFDEGSGAAPFYGNTKQVQYYNTALTGSELEELTSWESFIQMANGQNYTIK
jgi:hypothetical protein